jgi:hypothetical protein
MGQYRCGVTVVSWKFSRRSAVKRRDVNEPKYSSDSLIKPQLHITPAPLKIHFTLPQTVPQHPLNAVELQSGRTWFKLV